MQRLLPVLMLCLLPLGASAQSLYKCRIGGTLTYSGSPCPGVSSTAVEVPPPVKAEAGTEPDLKKMQADATKLQKERNAKDKATEKARRLGDQLQLECPF